MYFTPVNKNKIESVLEFLSNGFGWSLKRINQIREYIKSSNFSIEIYGFVMYDDQDSICSAILLPYQGYSNKYKIISLMSWYSKKSYRGISSILFAQKLYEFLKLNKFVITDYTPSKPVKLILQKLNFKTMKGFRKRDMILLKPHKLFYNYLSNKNNILTEYKLNNFPFKKFKVINYADANFITLDTFNEKSYFCCISRIVYKNIFGLKIPIPIVHILWAEDQYHLLNNWDILCFLLFKKYNSFCVIADFAESISSNKQLFVEINPLNYLISSEINDIGFIPSLGSELCLTNKNL